MNTAETPFFSSLEARLSSCRRRVTAVSQRDEHTADVVCRCAAEQIASFLLVADERSTQCAESLRRFLGWHRGAGC